MRKLLAIIPFAALMLASCSPQEVVPENKCVKIVGIKYYKVGLFGRIEAYFVLADGSERKIGSYKALDGMNSRGDICTTEYKPKK